MYGQFDRDCNDFLDWKQYCIGLSFVSSGSMDERIKFWFNILDVRKNGRVERHLLEKLFQWKAKVLNHPHDKDSIHKIVDEIWEGVYLSRRKQKEVDTTDSGSMSEESVEEAKSSREESTDDIDRSGYSDFSGEGLDHSLSSPSPELWGGSTGHWKILTPTAQATRQASTGRSPQGFANPEDVGVFDDATRGLTLGEFKVVCLSNPLLYSLVGLR